jgi:Flp pilus assembly protein TadD
MAGVVTHLPALQGERIWDDQYLSLGNPFIKSPLLILEAFRHYLFLDSLSIYYRPIQNISYIFDYYFWNTDAAGFHLTNILLHVASGILLFLLLRQLLASLLGSRRGQNSPAGAVLDQRRKLLRERWRRSQTAASDIAFLVAFIWIVHPVHSAAVDYISGRADSLAFAFASGGWLLFLRARQTGRGFIRCLLDFFAASSGFLALCSREIACVWLALFAAHLIFFDKTATLRLRVGALSCCAALLAIYIGCRHLPESRPVPSPRDEIDSVSVRSTLMLRALGDYGRLLIFPAKLHMERTVTNPIAYRSQRDWRGQIGNEYLSILGLAVFAALVFGSVWRGRGQPMRVFGAGWFLAAYLPVSNIVPLNATVAEHWLYLPSVGFFVFLTGCLIELPQRFQRMSVACVLFLAAALGARSYMRSTDWVTAETFYRRTIASGGGSPRSALNLGQIYLDRGDYAQAEKIFRRVLAIAPDYPLAESNLASALWHQGKASEAEALFGRLEKKSAEIAKVYPRTWIGALNLARVQHLAGHEESALAVLERARKIYPEVWELISLESEIVRLTRGPDAARALIEQFAARNWWHYQAALALGRLYAQKGDVDLATRTLQRASRLDVHETEALRLIAHVRLRQRQFDEALSSQQRAVARQPDEPRQYVLLSDILMKMGRDAEARTASLKASELRALAQR